MGLAVLVELVDWVHGVDQRVPPNRFRGYIILY